ncbi:MAG: hypothetical protein N3D10_01650 [Candidatus Micrarchaeota archaeon]|nr:hypothetical protein [Candidatus Micrarchaeota archaeon]
MYDLITYEADEQEKKETKMQLINLAKLPKNYFGVFHDLLKAKNQIKKYKIISIANYEVDEALAKLITQNNRIFAVVLSDFFLNDKKEVCRRFLRLKRCLNVLKKYNCSVRFFTLAKNNLQLRNCYELLFYYYYFGFEDRYRLKVYEEKFQE